MLELNEKLRGGQPYTFIFWNNSWLLRTDAALAARVQHVPGVYGVSVDSAYIAPETIRLLFTYNGPEITVADMGSLLTAALSAGIGEFMFEQADLGNIQEPCGINSPHGCGTQIRVATSLVAVAVVAVALLYFTPILRGLRA